MSVASYERLGELCFCRRPIYSHAGARDSAKEQLSDRPQKVNLSVGFVTAEYE